MSHLSARALLPSLGTLRKWRAVFGIYFQDGLAYRASGFIWVTTDVITAITMPLVWMAAAGSGMIGGFQSSDFVTYYLAMLMIGSIVTSHIMWEIAMEIREGHFSAAIVRPMSYAQFTFFRNLSWRLLRPILFLPFFLILAFLYRSHLSGASLNWGPEFWIAVLLGHVVSFNFVFMMAMLALIFQEAQALFELYYVPMLFLSGQLFPIAMLPDWARMLAHLFPFYSTVGVPTEILIGRLSGTDAWFAIGVQSAWILTCWVTGKFLWKFGLRHYTGIGM